ncbi:methyltransferase domain-containing protein [Streptomyces sp. NBC_00212]|uniref:methyltransferase domain-containing protein n=1 Tax=Streptomyces sp. NBC_00212 TaxID=2975684 RepID=UPI00324644FE
MAVVVVQQASAGVPAAVGGALGAAGLTVRLVRLDGGELPSIDLSDVEGLIILAAPHPAGASGRPLVREALAAQVPVLALGSGAELLAEVTATGSASKGPAVEPTRAASTDPLFAGSLPPGLRPDPAEVALPPGAVVLAAAQGYPGQAFRLGGSAWGVRFAGVHDGEDDTWTGQLLSRFAILVAARAEHTATRAFFTHRADAWEERFAHQTPAYEAAAFRMQLGPGATALDLGCGTGRAMPALREQVGAHGRVLGIDVTPAMLAAAARHGRTRHGHLLAADCARLPVPRRSVHGIFSAGLLDHLPDPRTALAEWARVATSDCVLLLFHPSGRAERAARHGRPLDPGDLLAEHNLRPALEVTGWNLDEYEDAPHHFLAHATLAG